MSNDSSGRAAFDTDPVLAAALDAVVMLDEAGLILDWNPAAEDMFGYSRGEAIGRPVTDLVLWPGGEGPTVGERVESKAVPKHGDPFPVEVALSRTDDQPA